MKFHWNTCGTSPHDICRLTETGRKEETNSRFGNEPKTIKTDMWKQNAN